MDTATIISNGVVQLVLVSIATGTVAVIGTLLWGRGGKKGFIRRLERVEDRTHDSPIINAPNVTQSVNVYTNDKRHSEARRSGKIMESATGPTVVGRYDKDNKAIYINTIHGRLAIRANDPNATMSDLTNWFDKYGILEPLDEK